MPPQSPPIGVVFVPSLLVSPPAVSSLYDVNVTDCDGVGPPWTWIALPWFCANSEAFSSLRVEPGWNTSIVSAGTEPEPSLRTALEPLGAWSTKLGVDCTPVIGSRCVMPGSATTTTGPRAARYCAAPKAERAKWLIPARSTKPFCWVNALKNSDVSLTPPLGSLVGFTGAN